MRMSKRMAGMVAGGILMLATLAPPANAVAPGRATQRVHCPSHAEHYNRWHRSYWVVTFVLKNDRNHRSTVYGSWHVDAARESRTVRHHADLAAGTRETFSTTFDGGPNQAPQVDLPRCR